MKRLISVKLDTSMIEDLPYVKQVSSELGLKLEDLITLEGGSVSDINIFFSKDFDELILSFNHEKSTITNPEGLL